MTATMATHGSAPQQLSMTLLMTPDMANFAGDVHGGSILRLLDVASPASAGTRGRTL